MLGESRPPRWRARWATGRSAGAARGRFAASTSGRSRTSWERWSPPSDLVARRLQPGCLCGVVRRAARGRRHGRGRGPHRRDGGGAGPARVSRGSATAVEAGASEAGADEPHWRALPRVRRRSCGGAGERRACRGQGRAKRLWCAQCGCARGSSSACVACAAALGTRAVCIISISRATRRTAPGLPRQIRRLRTPCTRRTRLRAVLRSKWRTWSWRSSTSWRTNAAADAAAEARRR